MEEVIGDKFRVAVKSNTHLCGKLNFYVLDTVTICIMVWWIKLKGHTHRTYTFHAMEVSYTLEFEAVFAEVHETLRGKIRTNPVVIL